MKQDADQDQSGSGGTQAIGQEANEQDAFAASLAAQGASNSNTPVRVDSKGDGGHVDQSNSVDSSAITANLNLLKQDADQDQGGKGRSCGCDGGGIQAIGQEAKNEQSAGALSAALQFGASNDNAPVRVDSKGDDGDVSQSNSVDSDATALNVKPDRAGRRPGPVGQQGVWLPLGDRHPGDRPGGEERAGGRCPLVRAPAGCEQLEHPCARGQLGRRR